MGFSAVLRILAGCYLMPWTYDPFLFTATKCAYVIPWTSILFCILRLNVLIPLHCFFLPVHTWYETCTFLVTVSVINIQDLF